MPNNSNHLISIVLPCYNGEKHVASAIKSCLNQTHKNFELIIVNDCSTDKTLDIVNLFAEKDKRIKIINNGINKKLPSSLNIGHKQAKGEFITWTSDDNVLKTNFLEKLLNGIIEKNVDIIYSNYDVISEEGNLKRIHKTGPTEHILFGNKIGASFLYKKEMFYELSGYDESLFLLEDYVFCLRASMTFKLHHLDMVLYQYRLHPESLTANIDLKKDAKTKHRRGAINMFNKLAIELSWKTETINFLTNHFLNKPLNVIDYLRHKQKIKNDILSFNSKNLNDKEIIEGLNSLLRSHLLSDHCNQNLKTLYQVFKTEKQLLLHPTFSKKTTFNYILKSLFN